jgi:hypothetical protein
VFRRSGIRAFRRSGVGEAFFGHFLGDGILGGEGGAVRFGVAGVPEGEEGEVLGVLGLGEVEGVGAFAGVNGPAPDNFVVGGLFQPGVDSQGHGELAIID